MAMTPKKQGGPAGKPKPTPKPAAPAPKSTRRTIPLNQTAKPPAKATPVKRTVTKVTPGKAGPASKGGPSIASSIAKRVGTVAREARDVVTAVSSVAKAGVDTARTGKTFALKTTLKDLPKQVKEVGTAATKGKIGTPALETNTGKKSQMKNQATVTQKTRSRKNYKG
jgi:hypothetical protein